MGHDTFTRRGVLATGSVTAGLALVPGALTLPALPAAPVALNVIDATGNLALTQPIFENFRKANPRLVSRFAFTKAPAPEIPGKIKAQQNARRVDIDLVLSGYDGFTVGVSQDLWLPLLPDFRQSLPDFGAILLEGAAKIQDQMAGQGICVSYSPYGPLLEYMPDRVKSVPKSAEELLAWSRENRGRFMYARPLNSGPGRSFMAGLPYMLGDADPRDPVKGWDKTWSYLEALGANIDYYPAGTSTVMKEFGDGSRDIIASTTGWDIYPRAIGIVPKEARIQTLAGFHWGSDAHVWAIPKGVSDEKVSVLLRLITFMMTTEQQAYIFSEGSFYPGPSVKGATLDLAPAKSREAIQEFGRPEYARLFAEHPIDTPLEPDQVVRAFRRWDEQIGAAKSK